MTTPPRARLVALVSTSTLALTLLAGCGNPPWEDDAAEPAAGATAAPTSTPTPTPTPSLRVARNDLSKGSVKRKLTAGGVEVAVTYYSQLPMDAWTTSASKPLNVSLTASFTDGSKQDIFMRQVEARVDVTGPDGQVDPIEPLEDRADVQPGYLITDPSSYQGVFTLPAVDPGAEALTLNLTYEMLAQSAPGSKRYLKQTAADTLQVTLTPA